MKNLLLLTFAVLIVSCSTNDAQKYSGESIKESYNPDGAPFMIADSAWRVDGRGNHRAVVEVTQDGTNAVLVSMKWRRPDLRPETKKIIVVEAATDTPVDDVYLYSLDNEQGEIAFKPNSKGTYYVYYLPYKYRKGWDDARYGKPWNDYIPAEYNASPEWVESVKNSKDQIAKVAIKKYESRSDFDFFTQMGNIATQSETDSIRKVYAQNPIIFTEDRAYPIRLRDRLPVKWVKKNNVERFTGYALPNEYYVWQLGVWAAHGELKNVHLAFSDLTNGSVVIPASEITCFNQEGTNWDGSQLKFNINVAYDKVQALWCGVQIPETAKSGNYKGVVTLTADEIEPRKIDLTIEVGGKALADNGDGDLWRHSRLRWLNSQIGVDNLPVAPYKAISVDNNRISATGKEVVVGKNGMIEQIRINDIDIFAKPLEFVVETNKGALKLTSENAKISKDADGLVTWSSVNEIDGVKFATTAQMEYDGFINYKIDVAPNSDLIVKDVKLTTSYAPQVTEYFMGVSYGGGNNPKNLTWNWQGPWDSYWMGTDKAGLHVEYRGGKYHGPLLNDYKPLPAPSWSNDGKGTIKLINSNTLTASTGIDTITTDGKSFEFALLITPVKEVDTKHHFSYRYFHNDPDKFEAAAKEGANIANIHHSKNLNPVINYPFIVRDSLISYINEQHAADRKVKLYYTIRELTNYTYEIYALMSLGNEIFREGPGYGLPWHTEHLIDGYRAAWYTELAGETSDAALVLSGFSRWINYYLEGMRWMFENYKLDGIYMDDVSFDRNVMKRMRKIFAQYRPDAVIDLHSNTGYSIGPANQYTDFFPYVDRLWFGESFKYNKMTPDQWFVTFSGVPFGVMSEMLQDGGNPFLGMVYGTTARHSYGQFSPAPVWQLWKDFDIESAKMLGYWDKNCPIKTSHPNVKATAYVKDGSMLISVGNFDDNDQTVSLAIDYAALGIDPKSAKLQAPAVQDFQEQTDFNAANPSLKVKSKGGWLLLLTK